jgi:uncharacterized protein (DUF433 family)
MMLIYPDTQIIPLDRSAEGIIRVAGTRIGLEVIVDAFNAGASPEEIAYNYDVLQLAQIYSIIAYYLDNKVEVDAYLEQLDERIEQIRQQTERQYGLDTLRQQLTARR